MVDTTCDGRWMEEFMLERLPEKILKVMEKHQGYPAVQYLMGLMGRPPQSYATIQMDNAGGHGSKECIKRYESGLLDKGFKVNFQPPNSPDLNVLDFGVWRGLQAEVDKLHRAKRNNPDVLTATCLEAWRKWGDQKQAEHINIWKRMMDQYKICIKMEGGNKNMEAQGKLKAELLQESEEEEEEED
mmetsp:Transcript_5243/g.9559  ORF Transcript_5243/g.9559 Transcript_5243/m.9559 type:complete len:186 (+) Transcript_5243:64-621(+)